ncbi:MAG TPA: uracil phosphoribosyltransferase [Chloroflexota bacterium]|nr:uracil phosphoribosyltransferase [Chloroflexota bacterium]
MRGVAQPRTEEVRGYAQLHVSSHPLVAHKLTLLRRTETTSKQFTELVAELSWLLGYEAMADLPLQPLEIETPMEATTGRELAERIGLVPILRAGLGMVAGFRELMPRAQVWHLGLYRNERTLQPVEYYNRLPERATVQICLLLDPMLATGGSALGAVRILKDWGAGRIKYIGLIAAPYGVQQLADQHPDVDIHVGALDRELNDRGYILPGLGDAGDRQFGTS